METHQQKVDRFLALKVIAVVGVSRNPKKGVGCFLLKKFRDAGYRVFPINPLASEIEGLKAYPDLKSVPEKIDAVFLVTPPKAALGIAQECAELGVQHVWFHRSFGDGSYSEEAAAFCAERGIEVIDHECPAMHLSPDIAHRCFKFFLKFRFLG